MPRQHLTLLLLGPLFCNCARPGSRPQSAYDSVWCDTTSLKPHGPKAHIPIPATIAGFGSVVGTVVRQETDDALQGALVRLSQQRNGYRLSLMEHPTDSIGGFRIDSVMPGIYRISVRHVGEKPDSSNIAVISGRADSVLFRLSVYRCFGY